MSWPHASQYISLVFLESGSSSLDVIKISGSQGFVSGLTNTTVYPTFTPGMYLKYILYCWSYFSKVKYSVSPYSITKGTEKTHNNIDERRKALNIQYKIFI